MSTDPTRETPVEHVADDLAHRFTYHPPEPEQPEVYRLVRDAGYLLALVAQTVAKPTRERSLAVTHIEEAVMWANAAIARHGLTDAAYGGADGVVDLVVGTLLADRPDTTLIDTDPVPLFGLQKREHEGWVARSDLGPLDWAQHLLTRAETAYPVDSWRVHPGSEERPGGSDDYVGRVDALDAYDSQFLSDPEGKMVDPRLIACLRNAADEWGALGVLAVARQLWPDAAALARETPAGDRPAPSPAGPERGAQEGPPRDYWGSTMAPLVVQADSGDVTVLNPEVLGGRGVLVVPAGAKWVTLDG